MKTSDLDLNRSHLPIQHLLDQRLSRKKESFYSYREIFLCSELNSRPQVYDNAYIICSDKY